MVNYEDLARVLREGDVEVETTGFDPILRRFGVDPNEAMRAAQQRSLRAFLLHHGQELPHATEPVNVPIPKGGIDEITSFAVVWLDGFVAGMRLFSRSSEGHHRTGGVR